MQCDKFKRPLAFANGLVYNLSRKVIGSKISDAPVKKYILRNSHLNFLRG